VFIDVNKYLWHVHLNEGYVAGGAYGNPVSSIV